MPPPPSSQHLRYDTHADLSEQVRSALHSQDLMGQFEQLVITVRSLGSCVVALSGGIDSSFLLAVASRLLKDRCVAVTAVSPALPTWDREDAQRAGREAEMRSARFREIATGEVADPRYAQNARSRCYFCKTEVYGRLTRLAREEGLAWVVDGTNATDAASKDRPGMLAAQAMNVRSPLAEVGLTKEDVRRLARAIGMKNWDRPASACLSSRIPYGAEITLEKLRRVESAESAIRSHGFRQVRVRDFGTVARVEVPREDLDRLLADPMSVDAALRSVGFESWRSCVYEGSGAGDLVHEAG